jgi:hypothetical protein
MRLVWEEEKAYEQRAAELAAAQEEGAIAGNGNGELRDTRSEQSGGESEVKGDRLPPAAEIVSAGQRDISSQSDSLQEHHLQRTSGSKFERESRYHTSAATVPQATATDGDGKGGRGSRAEQRAVNSVPGRVDKTKLSISTPRRIRDKEHLRYVASQPCIICGRSPGQAHHLRFAQPRALGRKVSDEWTVPLCSTHHGALHSFGDEAQWWKNKRIDPIAHAVRLWWCKRHGGLGYLNRIAEG